MEEKIATNMEKIKWIIFLALLIFPLATQASCNDTIFVHAPDGEWVYPQYQQDPQERNLGYIGLKSAYFGSSIYFYHNRNYHHSLIFQVEKTQEPIISREKYQSLPIISVIELTNKIPQNEYKENGCSALQSSKMYFVRLRSKSQKYADVYMVKSWYERRLPEFTDTIYLYIDNHERRQTTQTTQGWYHLDKDKENKILVYQNKSNNDHKFRYMDPPMCITQQEVLSHKRSQIEDLMKVFFNCYQKIYPSKYYRNIRIIEKHRDNRYYMYVISEWEYNLQVVK